MITIKSQREIDLMKIAGNLVYQTHQQLLPHIKVGITTNELDKIAEDFILKNDATPSFKGFGGFPKTLCTSINTEVVHGIPGGYQLKKGDIISIDIGVCYKGYHGDSAWTYIVESTTEEKMYLLKHTEEALYVGLNQVKPGNRVGDIGYAINEYATNHKLGVVKELCGHGIGTNLHEEPEVPNYGKQGKGTLLKEGMVIAIEPMLTLGSPEIFIHDNDWTIDTIKQCPSAHFEHTVVVTKDGFQILTGE